MRRQLLHAWWTPGRSPGSWGQTVFGKLAAWAVHLGEVSPTLGLTLRRPNIVFQSLAPHATMVFAQRLGPTQVQFTRPPLALVQLVQAEHTLVQVFTAHTEGHTHTHTHTQAMQDQSINERCLRGQSV